MIVSVNWLKKFTNIDVPVDELVQLIGERLVEVEEVIDLGARYKGAIVAQAKRVYKHPQADKLNVVELDDGGVMQAVERLENGCVQVVCGAPNVREGLKIVWLTPGAVIPATATDPKPVVLEARELRGVVSNGMIASGKELAINDDHGGIVELDDTAVPGSPFAPLLELDDHLLDIDNKSLTHRPDCFGLVGFAREVAAIQGQPFKTPDWLEALQPVLKEPDLSSGLEPVTVTIDDTTMCPRYEAAVIADVDVSLVSPLLIQSYLKRLGVRPINAAVDVTNYLMLVTGHPLHAFDYEKVVAVQGGGAPHIRVRGGRDGEQLTLLDGRTIEVTAEDILICAGDTPVGLAGAMGGANTEVGDTTKHIILEAATFNLYNLRSTSMRHGVFSEAVTRFTKGQPAAQTAPVLASAVRMLCDIAGGRFAQPVTDVYPDPDKPVVVTVMQPRVNALLGADCSIDELTRILSNVNFGVDGEGDTLTVTVPYWRQDIHIPEDIAEEIGRLMGFDTIEPELPLRPYDAVVPSSEYLFQTRLRNTLARMGANEALTYSFVPERLLKNVRQEPAHAFRIVNALSPSLQYYRLSLTPGVLEKVFLNSKAGFQDFALYELNKVHSKQDLAPDGLPNEATKLALVFASTKRTEPSHGAPYYAAKGYLDALFASLGIAASFEPMKDADTQTMAPYDTARRAVVVANGQRLGVIGEIHPQVAKNLKLPGYTAGFELDVTALQQASQLTPRYQPLSRFQGTTYDICFRTRDEVLYHSLAESVRTALTAQTLQWTLTPLDRYQPDGEKTVQTTFRVELVNAESNLTSEGIHQVMNQVADAARRDVGAEVI